MAQCLALSRALFRAIMNNCKHFNVEFFKWYPRKEKTKREKKKAKKKAKRMQKRVSLLSGLGAGEALPCLPVGGTQLRAGLRQKCSQYGPSFVGLGKCWQGASVPLPPSHPHYLHHSSQTGYGWHWPLLSTLVLPSGGGSKQKSWREAQGSSLPSGPSVVHTSKSSVAGVQAGTLTVFTALVCVSSPLVLLQPLLGVRVPLPE